MEAVRCFFYMHCLDIGLFDLLLHLIGAFAFDFVEDDFAQADVVGCYLYILVFLDVFEGFFEAEYYGRDEFYLVVRT